MSKCMLVTGGNRGLGLGLAKAYLKLGWKVWATYRNSDQAQELLSLEKAHKGILCPLQMDVTLDERVAESAKQVSSCSEPLSLLILNAGVYGKRTSLSSTNVENIQKAMDVNLLGAFRVVKAFYPFLERNGGKIVCMTSLMGSIGDNSSGGSYPYRISKAALNMFGRTLSIDLKAEGIAVLVLHPGWVRTRMGGKLAPLSLEESVSGMVQTIQNFTLKESGSFLAYDGRVMPW